MENGAQANAPIIPKDSSKKHLPFQTPDNLIPYLVNYEDFELNFQIGTGAFGNVWKALDKKNDRIVAIKVLTKEELSLRELQHFITEAQILIKAQSQFIVPFYGFSNCYPYCLITKLARNSNLNTLIGEYKNKKLPGTTFTKIAIGIVAGMIHLHSLDIIHRDLKPSNILLDTDFVPMICDFGISRTDDGSHMTKMAGTPMWMAPEIIDGKDYTLSADVFSFGMLLYEMNTLQKPFPMMESIKIVKAIKSGYRPPIPDTVEKNMKKLIESCWDENPDNRPPFVVIFDTLTKFKACFQNCVKEKVKQFIKEIKLDQNTMKKSMSFETQEGRKTYHPLTLEDFINDHGKIDVYTIIQFLVCSIDYLKTKEYQYKYAVLSLLQKVALRQEFTKTIVDSNVLMVLPFGDYPDECVEFICRVVVRSNDDNDADMLRGIRNILKYAKPIYTLKILQAISMRSLTSSPLKLLIQDSDSFIYEKDCIILYLKILLNYVKENRKLPLVTESCQLIFSTILEKEKYYRTDSKQKVDENINSNDFYNEIMKLCYKGLLFLSENSVILQEEGIQNNYKPNIKLKQVLFHLEDIRIQKYVINFLKNIEGFPVNKKTLISVTNACINQKNATLMLLDMIENNDFALDFFLKHKKWAKNELPDWDSTFQIFLKIYQMIKKKNDEKYYSKLISFLDYYANEIPIIALKCLQIIPKGDVNNNSIIIDLFKKSYVICSIFYNLIHNMNEKTNQTKHTKENFGNLTNSSIFLDNRKTALSFLSEFSSFIGKGFSTVVNYLIEFLGDEQIAQKTVETLTNISSNKKCKRIFLKVNILKHVQDSQFVHDNTKKHFSLMLE